MVHKETRTDVFTEERLDDAGMNRADVIGLARAEATKLERSISGVVEVSCEPSLAHRTAVEWRVWVPDEADETLVGIALSFTRQRFHGRAVVPDGGGSDV